MSSPSPSDSVIDIEQVVNSLLQRRRTSQSHDDDPFLYLLLDLKTNIHSDPPLTHIIDILTTNPIRLPHSILSNPPKLGLIINDTTTNYQELILMHVAEKKIQSFDKPINISRIFKLSELQADQSPSSSKKSLLKSFDMLFADKSMRPLLDVMFRDIGVVPPVWLDLKNNEDWEGQVERACNSTFLHSSAILICCYPTFSGLTSTLTCYVGKVGRDSMNMEDIVDNVAVVWRGIANVVPNWWDSISSLHLKFSDFEAKQIYQQET